MTGTDQNTDTQYVNLEQALAELAAGGTHTAVAQTLSAAGIKGFKGNAYDCPIARYLRLRTGRTDIGVAPRGVYQVLGDCRCGHCSSKRYSREPIAPIPAVVTDFILIFDGIGSGHQVGYRDLIEA